MRDKQENISEEDARSDRRAKDQFYLQSNFVIDELLLSGLVVYNDPVSLFAGKVLDELLKNDPELRSELEVYVVKSSEVNAFTTNNGIILITLGLISNLENEAQLAFILSHEVVHYIKQHSLTGYIENENIQRGRGVYRQTSNSDKLLAKSTYSKSQEKEADLEGFDLFLKSSYDLNSIDGVFDVLRYAHVPFDVVPFDISFLETDYFKFPEDYKLEQTQTIEADEEEDEYGTHPGVPVRQEALDELLQEANRKGGRKYIVGQEEFETVRKISRFEIINTMITHRNYEAALYHTYLLLLQDTGNAYLKKNIVRCLYGITKYANAGRFYEVRESYEDIEGPSQQVYYLFERMGKKEMNVVALLYTWDLKKLYPNDREIRLLAEDLVEDLVENHTQDLKYFASSIPKIDTAIADSSYANDSTRAEPKMSKYDKIKAQQVWTTDEEDEEDIDYTKYAFIDLLKDKSFIRIFEEKLEEYEMADEKDNRSSYKDRQKAFKRERQNRRRGYALGIDKVVFVNPFYYVVDERKRESLQLVASESAQKEFGNQIRENAKMAGLKYSVLDKKELKRGGTETFNDLMVLNQLFDERTEHDDLDFQLFYLNHMDTLREKYNTRYFAWTGTVAVHESWGDNLIDFLDASANTGCAIWLVYPAWPYMAYQFFKPQYNTYLMNIIVDLETGELVFSSLERFKFNDSADILNSALYDLFKQIKNNRD
ncbi:MAG: M48 family metallopeptidase [Bacteroidota bacterium]|nr:M48 family metallopeptidase [Bacteroidota bacterium]